jgi:hypothetical protein
MASHSVGRGAELDRLEAALTRARTGDPVTVCVEGEAGVGKSRLVAQFTDRVRETGDQVLIGGCIELGEGSLPYAPVVQALRGLGRGLEPGALDDLVGPGRPLLARLLPELGYGEESSAPVAAGSASQARLFEAFLGLLERLAGGSATVLVVEDLHWADRSTLDLLTFLVRNLRAAVLLVLTYRTDELHRRHPLRPFLAELDRRGGIDRLEVGRLNRSDTRDLLAGLLWTTPQERGPARPAPRSRSTVALTEARAAGARFGSGCRRRVGTAPCRPPGTEAHAVLGEPSWPDSRGTTTPLCGRRPPKHGSIWRSRTRRRSRGGVRRRPSFSAARAASRLCRRCGRRTTP